VARFDLYRNPDGKGYLLDLQSDLIGGLNTRVVAPLIPLADAPRPARRLNPVFDIADGQLVMATQFMAAVPTRELRERIGSLADQHDAIMNALDMIFTGF
jgi:toxin CcdB